ncbi:MAG: GNAT family N-acetyltransferase [Thermoguttaceae bacterium]|jgi:CelD/BcsL family acetyltransferase involved in cellulose biosynthesis|nr:GNAT family N-acetyltransferase [Thermoguttaceae bacterium]
MSGLCVERLASADEIRGVAPAWDALWQQSNVTLPTARAELVAQWIEHFAPHAKVRAIVVRDGGKLVAAIPLVGRRLRGILPVGDLASNYWSPNGELLLDPQAEAEATLAALVGSLPNLPWPLLWLELVPLAAPSWQALLKALAEANIACDARFRYEIGQIEIRGDYATYEAGRSKSLRRNLRKDLRRLESTGPLELRLYDTHTPEEVDARLRTAFDIEDRSWKGMRGQTVLRTPGMFEFYCRQARQLAAWGALRVAFLQCKGRPIAFEIGWMGKGVYHSFKVGFDEALREFGPGHLLRMHLVRHCFERGDVEWIDFQGPQTEALAAWSTHTYPIGRMAIATCRLTGRALLAACRAMAGVLRSIRGART